MSARTSMRNQRGMSLVEVLVSMLLVTIVTFGLLRFTSTAYQGTRHNDDRQLAVQKAISMLEELKSLVQTQGGNSTVLDAYDDGNSYESVLTTDTTITDPLSPSSGNSVVPGGTYKYARQITVSMLPGTTDPDVRLVNVKVVHNRDENADGKLDVLAEVAGVVRTAAPPFAPTQVYDVYALAIENVPGWWVYMSNLIPFMQTAFQNLQARNPGLEFRVHWITKLAYGRDQEYRPQINRSVDSLQPINNVYFYPGKMPSGQAVDFYYPPDNFKGHILVDSTDTNGYNAATNPNPYALADQYNNAMRYPEEEALFNARVASGQETDDAPTFRILMERVFKRPDRYRNAIFVNLHGELFPFPPIRNYSDPAKEPTNYLGVRVVTHPERVHYTNSATSVTLRVYAYRTAPAPASFHTTWLGQGTSATPVMVTLKGITWTPAAGAIVRIEGGTDQDGTTGADTYASSNAPTALTANRMYYTATSSGGDTVLRLYNTPLTAPEKLISGSNYAGLHASQRLYGLEYFPAPSEDLTPSSSPPTAFTSNLLTAHTRGGSPVICNGGDCTKNPARWIITIPAANLPGGAGGNGLITVETRINSTTSGTRTNQPPNLSETYIWRGSDTWCFGDGTSTNPPNMPFTERFQFLGDPRHNPYADLKSPYDTSGLPRADTLGMGFNRYFDDFEDASANAAGAPWWKGYSYSVSGVSYGVKNDGTVDNDGWKSTGSWVEMDVHRIYQVMRALVARPRGIFTSMTGYSHYYCGIGNEIGYDSANGFTNSIPINSKLFTGVSGSTYEDSILPSSSTGVKYVRENVTAPYWWGVYWLGELYPDSLYTGVSGWAATGNLPTGSGANTFVRVERQDIPASCNLPRGTTFLQAGRRTGPEGSTTFYWTGSASSTFHHESSDGNGDLLAGGTEIASRFNYPLSNGIPINRPFGYNVNATGDNPDHFLQTTYGPVYTAAYLSDFYDHSVETSDKGSALLTLANGSEVGFVAVNGISMTGDSGTSFIANWSLLTLIQSFLAAGRYNSAGGYANHVEQVPRIQITSPNATTNLNNPSSLSIGWTRDWKRWDGQSYTTSFPSGYSESSALSYTVMYSADGGTSWKYMQTGNAAIPGVRPSSSSNLISSSSATPSYSWSTPSGSFPAGTYLIRVEAYRDTLPLHYAYHQYRAFIRR